MDILTFKQAKNLMITKVSCSWPSRPYKNNNLFSGKGIPYISISLNMNYMINSKRNSKSLCTQR